MPDQPPEHRPASAAWAAGLSAILPRSRADEPGLREIALELIAPNPRQPRRDFDEDALLALAESIRSRGCSSRSWCARSPAAPSSWWPASAGCAPRGWPGWRRSPRWCARPRTGERLELALAENMARVDLNPIEEARACAMLVEDLGLTKEEVGRRVGQEPRGGVEPDPPARAARRGARADRGGRPERGPRPRDPDRARTTTRAGAWPSPPATAAGRCARPSAAPEGPSAAPQPRERAPSCSTPTWPRRWPRPRTR